MTARDIYRSPQSGDRVRAVTDDRDATQVEGILYIRHVPTLNYAQLHVLSDGRASSVLPDSIEVLAPQEVTREQLEYGDPLVGEPGRRWIVDVAEAVADGLVQEPSSRVGGTWSDMFEQLAARAKPMRDAGWQLISTEREESWEFGDSVFYDLQREGEVIELEYYSHGTLVAYRMDEGDEGSDDPESGSIFSIPDSTAASARAAFRACGWI